MIDIAICEDEPIHLRRITELIDKNISEEHRFFEFYSADEFKEYTKQGDQIFDILFLDIELEKESGIVLAEEVHSIFPGLQIIFVSQYLDYVSSVYETEHAYFIYKENLAQYISLALDKVLKHIHTQEKRFLEFYWNKNAYYVSFDDIIYIERILRTTEIHTQEETYYTSEKLTSLLPRLDENFAICHQSFLINMSRISVFDKKYIILDNHFRIPVSRAHYTALKQQFCRHVLS